MRCLLQHHPYMGTLFCQNRSPEERKRKSQHNWVRASTWKEEDTFIHDQLGRRAALTSRRDLIPW